MGGIIVCIPHGKRYEGHHETNQNDRRWAAQMQLQNRKAQTAVWFDVIGDAEVGERLYDRLSEKQDEQKNQVDDIDSQEKNPFACLSVVELPKTRDQGHDRRCIWIFRRWLKALRSS